MTFHPPASSDGPRTALNTKRCEQVHLGLPDQRLSKRSLHRQAVKKFNDRRRLEESMLQAKERDGKLLRPCSNGSEWRSASVNGRDSGSGCTIIPVAQGTDESSGHSGHGKDRVTQESPTIKWDFEFFFRTMPSELLGVRAEAVGGTDGTLSVQVQTQEHRHEEHKALMPPPQLHLYEEEEQALALLEGSKEERPLKESIPIGAVSQGNVAHSVCVRRVEGVSPLPMIAPMKPGTDLNPPPWNYLTPDPTYNVHQHAPGFLRDENAARRSLLACAMRNWRGGADRVLMLSTGEALRSVFEVTYNETKPLALHVRRIGPMLLVDAHKDQEVFQRVQDLREKALMCKALYRIWEESSDSCGSEGAPTNLLESKKGVVALATHRIGSAALSKRIHELSRYSQVLHWEIGAIDAIVGTDAPVVNDCRDNTELVLRLKDTSTSMTPEELQRETLNTWFDATLANVPNIGVFVHCDGVVERYEVRKVHETLGLVEGRIAAAAMNFTTNVLHWLMSQCRDDGKTYTVIQNYESKTLEIYEYTADEALGMFLPEEGAKDTGGHATDDERKLSEDEKKASDEERRRAEENEQLNCGLANMCLRMGLHLKNSVDKAPDAVALLLRTLSVYSTHRKRIDEACQHVGDIVEALPGLIGLLIVNRKTALEKEGGNMRIPEIYREAFLTCGRFGMWLQEAMDDASLRMTTRQTLLQYLLPCSAALFVCVTRGMEQFIVERRLYQQLKATNGKDSNVRIHSLITKDLLQVVVEGLVRLEKMRDAVNSGVKTIQCCDGVDNVGKHALVDAKMGSMDSTPLEKALWELYADIVLLAMSDRTPFTANVLVELSRRIREREERRAAIAASASSVVGTPVAISPAVDSALSWLSAITPDVVSLSFTALKYLAKAGNKHKRLQAKTAQVYYYVGQHYLSTDRYTKALESLHRAQSFYKAVGTEECDEVFGMYSVSSTITLKDVRYSLGEVFLRMAHLKSNIVPTAKISMDHVVAMGDVRPLSPEEDSFYRQAVDHFSHCEAPERLASALLVYGGRQIAHIASCGQQEDAAKGRNIYSLLRRVCELDNQKTAALEWEVLRLCSSTAPYGALQRWAEDVHQQWGGASALSDEGASNKLLLAVHPLEYELQMALVSVSLLEVKRNVKSHKLFALARSCSAYLTNALNLTHEACADADDKVTRVLATWNAQCAHELTYRLTLPISIRCCRALLRTLPGDKGLGTRSTLHRLLEMEESARNVAGSKRGKAADVRKCECCYSALLEPLVETLKEMSGW